jgi:hypothetical protein
VQAPEFHSFHCANYFGAPRPNKSDGLGAVLYQVLVRRPYYDDINLMSNQLDAWCRNNNYKRNKFSQLETENLKIGEFGFFVLKLKFD